MTHTSMTFLASARAPVAPFFLAFISATSSSSPRRTAASQTNLPTNRRYRSAHPLTPTYIHSLTRTLSPALASTHPHPLTRTHSTHPHPRTHSPALAPRAPTRTQSMRRPFPKWAQNHAEMGQRSCRCNEFWLGC